MKATFRRIIVPFWALLLILVACTQTDKPLEPPTNTIAPTSLLFRESELIADDSEGFDSFGFSVSIDGNLAIVGAPESGSAYIFAFDGNSWTQQAKLVEGSGNFGISVAIDGTTAVVGAMGLEAAYVFVYDGNSWTKQAELQASENTTSPSDSFGRTVSVSGDTVIVGAPTGKVDGKALGTAYVFGFDNGDWVQQAQLIADDGAHLDQFGFSVDIAGDMAVIGAPTTDVNATDSGSAYIFAFDGSTWSQQAKLSVGRRLFGYSVATADGTTIIGSLSGRAYIFSQDAGVWTHRATLLPDSTTGAANFGFSVDIHGAIAVVGANRDDTIATSAGAAFVFTRDGDTWNQAGRLLASDGQIYDQFGVSVAISGNIVLVGAQRGSGSVFRSGAAYVYELSAPNSAPTAAAGGPYTTVEGTAVLLSGSGSDPDGDALRYQWSVDSPLCTFTDVGALSSSLTCRDDGNFNLVLTVSDGVNEAVSSSTTLTVANAAPLLEGIVAPSNLVEVNTPVTVSANFTDPGIDDTHTAVWNWGDGSSAGTINETGGSGTVEDTHTYTVPDVYTLQLTVTDDEGDSDTEIFQYVVIYNPEGGFVTGGGWIESPEGAYASDPTLTGKANFGFVSKYRKNASTPSGQTQFQFRVADLTFHSSTYDWLVVNQGGRNAQFKGRGTISGHLAPNNTEYRFMIWAGDGSRDTFRIRIWFEDGGTEYDVYDNGMDQLIAGGSIKIHKP